MTDPDEVMEEALLRACLASYVGRAVERCREELGEALEALGKGGDANATSGTLRLSGVPDEATHSETGPRLSVTGRGSAGSEERGGVAAPGCSERDGLLSLPRHGANRKGRTEPGGESGPRSSEPNAQHVGNGKEVCSVGKSPKLAGRGRTEQGTAPPLSARGVMRDQEQLDQLVPLEVARGALDAFLESITRGSALRAMQQAILLACRELKLHRHLRGIE